LLLNTAVVFTAGSNILFWIVQVICSLAGAIVSFFAYNPVIIGATAFTGSYLFFRGISLFAGGYPNEFTLVNQLASGEVVSITDWFYLYLGLIIISTLLCSKI